MTLNQMRYFQLVCRYKNYTKAANELFVSQPAISQAIRQLELECGVLLLNRMGSNITITDAGEVLLKEINSILLKVDRLEGEIRHDGLMRNFIRVGMSTFSGNSVFPEICKNFHEAYPDITIDLSEGNTKELFQNLDELDLDLIITSPRNFTKEEFERKYDFITLKTSGLSFYLGINDPRSSASFLSLKELAQIPIVMLNKSYPSSMGILNIFSERNLTPNVLLYTSQMYTIERFVSQSAAGGFLPLELSKSNNMITRIPYESQVSRKPIQLIWKKGVQIYPSMKKFIDIAKFTSKQLVL